MTTIRCSTPDGVGTVLEKKSTRGRTEYLVEGTGFRGWYDALEVFADIDDGEDRMPLPDGTMLPYNPNPQFPDVNGDTSSIQPGQPGIVDLTPTDSVTGEQSDDPDAATTLPHGELKVQTSWSDKLSHFNVQNVLDELLRTADEKCETCEGSGKIMSGNRECPDCKGEGCCGKTSRKVADNFDDQGASSIQPGDEPGFTGDLELDGLITPDEELDKPFDNTEEHFERRQTDSAKSWSTSSRVACKSDTPKPWREYLAMIAGDVLMAQAAWADVRKKATRLRRENQVFVESHSKEVVYGKVQGDNGIYDVTVHRLGGHGLRASQVSGWDCTCEWGKWAFVRERKFVGRMCSHAYAMYQEMQSQDYRKQRRAFGEDDANCDKCGVDWPFYSADHPGTDNCNGEPTTLEPGSQEFLDNFNDKYPNDMIPSHLASRIAEIVDPYPQTVYDSDATCEQCGVTDCGHKESSTKVAYETEDLVEPQDQGPDHSPNTDFNNAPKVMNPEIKVDDPLLGIEVPHDPDYDPNSYRADGTEVDPEDENRPDLRFDSVVSSNNVAAQWSDKLSYLMESDNKGDDDIAKAAQAFLARTAGKQLTPAEQEELVAEAGEARNLDLLDLTGTHYLETI